MADAQTRDRPQFVDKRFVFSSNQNAVSATFIGGNAKDILALKTRLAAINAAYYTPTVLNQMTYNDMVFAVRINDESAGLNW